MLLGSFKVFFLFSLNYILCISYLDLKRIIRVSILHSSSGGVILRRLLHQRRCRQRCRRRRGVGPTNRRAYIQLRFPDNLLVTFFFWEGGGIGDQVSDSKSPQLWGSRMDERRRAKSGGFFKKTPVLRNHISRISTINKRSREEKITKEERRKKRKQNTMRMSWRIRNEGANSL